MNETEIFELALKKWGPQAQMNMAKEEAAELIQALCKFDRTVNGSTIKDVAEEIADVEIMTEQLRLVFGKMYLGDFNVLVNNIRKRKLDRLELILKHSSKESG